MTNNETRMTSFVIRISGFNRISDFVIRIYHKVTVRHGHSQAPKWSASGSL